MSDKIFMVQSDVIKGLAKKGPCVIIGRCAASVLKDEFDIFSVFIHADIDARMLRVAEYEKITSDQAFDLIKKSDKKRASYHNYYSELKWGDATSYDICINSKIGFENAAQVIVDCVNLK